jgi:threonine aldolase
VNNEEIKNAFNQCNRFFNSHRSVNLKEEFLFLSTHVFDDEMTEMYGSGKCIEDFENVVADILGKPKGVFMISGTMAQAIALRIWSDRKKNPNFGMHPSSHLEMHEHKAYLHLHNLNGHLLGEFQRMLSLDDIKNCSTKLAAVIIELPQRESGGILPAFEELVEISKWCKSSDVILHLDGARLWECGPYYKKSYKEICALFDSVYVSFYKGLGAMAGAILAGPEDFINEAKIWQRRQGGNLYTLAPYVISARASLEIRLGRMEAYHEKAKEVASILSSFDKLKIVPAIPQTNMMHVFFHGDLEKFEQASAKIAQEEKVCIFRKLRPTDDVKIGKWELAVGDDLMNFSNDEIHRMFKKIVDI